MATHDAVALVLLLSGAAKRNASGTPAPREPADLLVETWRRSSTATPRVDTFFD